MPTFRCDDCGCIENTALSNFWMAEIGRWPKRLCSQCDPEIGAWHKAFERIQWDDSKHAKYSGMPPECLKRWKADKDATGRDPRGETP